MQLLQSRAALLFAVVVAFNPCARAATEAPQAIAEQAISLDGNAEGKRFDGIGAVNGGGATSVLLKDYPEPQRSQILDLLFKPKFGASTSALLVEIPGDGNSTQGSMPSHMHTREDLNYSRGYIWWVLAQAKKRNSAITLDGTAWSAPGWVGQGKFWSQDTADYYVKWLTGLRDVYGLEFDAIGCRNEKGESLSFAEMLRSTLNANGFAKVKLHAFDNWPDNKFNFVTSLENDAAARDAIDILSAHVLYGKPGGQASADVQAFAERNHKPIWNTEDHVYKKGFDCEISIVQCFNENYLQSGATKIMLWYDVAGVYPTEPYSEDPAMLLARSPWSGHYDIREALWGYAHYGQFSAVGWHYLKDACGHLNQGGSFITLVSPEKDYSVIIESKDAKDPQQLSFAVNGGLSSQELCVWRSDETAQFVQQSAIHPVAGKFTLKVEPHSIYSISTTRGQQKGAFASVPPDRPFPFPYRETFDGYASPKRYGYLPRFTADISGAFELVDRLDGHGQCLRQMAPIPTISWAPDWQPYTILGDAHWSDYAVSVDVSLQAGEKAAIMGRINQVGTGYGFIPKGYFLELSADGHCRLVVIRGKVDKKKIVGDAEQQALLKKLKDGAEGGEKVLGEASVAGASGNVWHTLTLRFQGPAITGQVDGKDVLSASDPLYSQGMVGLLAGAGPTLSRPYYDNLVIKAVEGPAPSDDSVDLKTAPMYELSAPR